MWQAIWVLLTIIFSIITLGYVFVLLTTKELSTTECSAYFLCMVCFGTGSYLAFTLYKLHKRDNEWETKQEERHKKEQALIDSLSADDPEWLTKRKLNLLEASIKNGLKENEEYEKFRQSL